MGFLPKSWKNTLNFVYLQFQNFDPDACELGDILILDLATRRRTWMDSQEIRSQIRIKIPEHEIDGEQFVLVDFFWSCAHPILHRIKVRSNEIEMKHQIIMNDYRNGDIFIVRY